MRNVAIFGTDGAGKSTLARNLISHYHNFHIAPMAESLRIEIANSGLATLDELWQKPTPPHIRHLLINYAKDRRAVNPDEFIEKWVDLNYIERGWYVPTGVCNVDNHNVVVDDTRYLNEFDYFHSNGFLTVFIDAPIHPDQYNQSQYYKELDIIKPKCELYFISKASTPRRMVELMTMYL